MMKSHLISSIERWRPSQSATGARRVGRLILHPPSVRLKSAQIRFPQSSFRQSPRTFDVTDGTTMTFSMAALANITDGSFRTHLQELVDSYRFWIGEQSARVGSLGNVEHQTTAKGHLATCQEMADRIERGIAFLESNSNAARAFVLANRAMLYQRVRSRRKRTQVFNAEAGRITFDPPFVSLGESLDEESDHANWRPFQLAFLLANLKSAVDGTDKNRQTVDLLWFPTGGGKTEAYLGLSAFTIFYRRLQDVNDVGTTVLMRYTLRLLTAQQFQRASALICAMEVIRAERPTELGTKPIRIGMWVGGGSTPNRSSHAVELTCEDEAARIKP